MIPRLKDNIEEDIFNEFPIRVNDEFLKLMIEENKQEREKREAEKRKFEEEKKKIFLKDKWYKIINSMCKNYKNVDIDRISTDPIIIKEIKRCMYIPSEFLKTHTINNCIQCTKKLYIDQEPYKKYRHSLNPALDFDGHFPHDHITLNGFVEYTKEDKNEDEKEYLREKETWPPFNNEAAPYPSLRTPFNSPFQRYF